MWLVFKASCYYLSAHTRASKTESYWDGFGWLTRCHKLNKFVSVKDFQTRLISQKASQRQFSMVRVKPR